MCGIAGIMTRDGSAPDPALLDRLAAAIGHRGPDGEGRTIVRGVGLVQRRLAIIDIAGGDQPLFEPGGAALVANGEIYNYIELRAGMTDVRFATQSDCEPPLHLYRRHGVDFASTLRGMYAIAIFDPLEDQLVLARDPFGIKPLYYAQTDRLFAFASEPQALFAAGILRPRIDARARAELLQLQYTTGAATIFEGISRVQPGETLVVRAGRVVSRARRWSLPADAPEAWSDAEAIARLDAALTDSVAVHQRSDVPYGMFLSGGVDSSAILSVMARLNARPVHAFTMGFAEPGAADERARAREIAAALGAEMEALEFSSDDFWRVLPQVAAAADDPAADYAMLPSWVLAGAARRAGLKVILTGEGGDELFAGYGRYRYLAGVRPWWRGGRAMRARGTFDGLSVLAEDVAGWRDGVAAAETTARLPGRTRLQVAQAADCADWLPNDILLKLDRCLMAHGVEGRTPFLDPVVADVAFRLADRQKVRDGTGKWLLRKWLDERLPQAQAFAKKRGFTVPVGAWIARRGAELGPLVARHPAVAEIAERKAVEALFAAGGSKRAGFAAWTLLFWTLWYDRHVLGRVAAGDTFEVLREAKEAA